MTDQDLLGDVTSRKRAREGGNFICQAENDMPAAKRQADAPTELIPIDDDDEENDIYIPSSFVGGGLFSDRFRNPQLYNKDYSIMIPVASDRFTLDDIDLPFDRTEWMLVGVVLYMPHINFELKRISVEHLDVSEMDKLETELTGLEYGATEVFVLDEQTVTTRVKLTNFFADFFQYCQFKEQTISSFIFLPKLNKSEHIIIKQDLTFIHSSLVVGFALDKVEATRSLSVLMLYAGDTRFVMHLKAYTLAKSE